MMNIVSLGDFLLGAGFGRCLATLVFLYLISSTKLHKRGGDHED